jgi:predicted transposase YbfD/YdcC
MFVKENQPTLLRDIEQYFGRAFARAAELRCAQRPEACFKSQRVHVVHDAGPGLGMGQSQTLEKGHGRIERRDLHVLDAPHWMDWPGAGQVIQVERNTQEVKTGKKRSDTVYAVTSLSQAEATADQLQQLCRGHWSIENSSHWVRDVTFDEDRSTVRRGSIPQVMTALRNTASGLLRLNGHTNIAATCRSFAYNCMRAAELILNPPTFE